MHVANEYDLITALAHIFGGSRFLVVRRSMYACMSYMQPAPIIVLLILITSSSGRYWTC